MDEPPAEQFRTPSVFSITHSVPRRILMIGSCITTHLTGFLKQDVGVDSDFVHFGDMIGGREEPPLPLANYDIVIVNVPLDFVYVGNSQGDLDQANDRLELMKGRLRVALEASLRWSGPGSVPHLVCNFPVPQQTSFGRLQPRYDSRNAVFQVEELNLSMGQRIDRSLNCHLLDIDAIASSLGRRYVQDDSVWAFSHGAFLTDFDFNELESMRGELESRLEPIGRLSERIVVRSHEMYREIVSEVLASHRTLLQVDSVKLIVIDLDDTAWRGVIAEQGMSSREYHVAGWHLGFVEALDVLSQRGLLLGIISKNEESTALSIWHELYRNTLPLDRFSVIKINWESKAANMEVILRETGLLAENVVFVDDNPVERESMKSAHPSVRVLGSDVYGLRRALMWAPETQLSSLTQESINRTRMVKAQIEREQAKGEMQSEEFLLSLALDVQTREVRSVDDEVFPRFLELLNKTNQFNTTGRRWTAAEIDKDMDNGLRLMAGWAKDRFTDYGLVACALVLDQCLIQVCMSCRTIGLGVDSQFLAWVESTLRAESAVQIMANLRATNANAPVQSLFARHGFNETAEPGLWQKALA